MIDEELEDVQMSKEELEKQFNEYIDGDDSYILVLFNMAQDLVQYKQKEPENARALNMIVGSAFALYHALQTYKEIENGKGIKHRSRIKTSKIRS